MDNVYNTQEASNIEPEMQSRSGSYPMTKVSEDHKVFLNPILTQAFISQPFLGNIVITDDQRRVIHEIARSILTGALNRTNRRGFGLDDFQCDILVLETVLLLRNWSDDDNETDEDTNQNFWEYICNQYAITYDYYFGGSHEYRLFRYVITRSLTRNKRFFVKTGQRFYTSMLTHAFAPKIRFNALFEQIFAFYAKSLDYHYIKHDPAFKAFASAMKNRFTSGKAQSGESVYIKSVQSSSAIIALFKLFPNYMSDFVEHVIHSVDTLVAKGKIQETTYIDTLLMKWYENRSREVRTSDRKKRSTASADRVVTDFANIRPLYKYGSGKVSLFIPSIRLGAETDFEPRIVVYRYPGDENPYSDILEYFGDSFCITSSKKTINLDELITGSTSCIEPRVVISHGGNEIFDSGTKLYRDAIIFSDDGGETTKRPDKDYINVFVTDTKALGGLETSFDYFATMCGKGYIYRIMIDENAFISVNESNLFPVVQVISGLTLEYSIPPVGYCTYIVEEHIEHKIFLKQPVITISSEEQNLSKRYRIMIDNNLLQLEADDNKDKDRIEIALPDSDGVHELRVIDNVSHYCVLALNYVIFDEFSLKFNGFYYSEGFEENGSVEVLDNGAHNTYQYEKQENNYTMLINYKDGDLSVQIPTLRCQFNDEYQSPDTECIYWYKNIPMSSTLEIEPPRGFNVTVSIGERVFKSDSVEIGNEVNISYSKNIESVILSIYKDGKQYSQIKLFDVVFEPTFLSPPLSATKESLIWYVEENFIGDADCEFKLNIYVDGYLINSYSIGYSNEEITLEYPLEDGVYDYAILMKAPGIFSKFEEIKTGILYIGDQNVLRFIKHSVVVTEAIIDNESIDLKKKSGIITNLKYVGVLPLNGEALPYPCYEGCLQFRHDGVLRPLSRVDAVRNGIRFEQVNPVKLWVINEYTISLRNPTNDGLYVHRIWKSITDREPQNNSPITDYYNPVNYIDVDYYSYEVITNSEVYDV